ncbi:MAG: Do family serine endopeptidase [Pseudomonadota bacterium]
MNRPVRTLLLVGAIALALPVACTAQQPEHVAPLPVPSTAPPAVPMVTGLPDFTNLVQQVGPAVVNISAEIGTRRVANPRGQLPDDERIPEFFRRFFGEDMPFPGMPDGGPRGLSQGTGFLISDDGYILTNHHVVANATQVTVRLSDRREFQARLVGSDEQSDVALLKIEGRGLPALRTATQPVKPGQWVVAIGSPFGLEHSVTAGIVSAVGRATGTQQYVPFIQTDVAINRGNSGGPLLNTRGEVVGINSQIFSNSGGYMGVSFAIPIDLAVSVTNQLRTTGRVQRGLLGVGVEPVDAEAARGFGLPDTLGALVNEVQPGGAADKAGIRPGDVIRAVNGRAVATHSDLPPLIGALPPGSRVRLSLFRDGRTIEIPVVLDALAEGGGGGGAAPQAAPAQPDADPAGLGLAVQDLTAAERRRLGLRADEGVRIARVDRGPAGEAGLRAGDIVLQVGRTPVGSAAAFARAVAQVPAKQAVMLLVRRDGGSKFVPVGRD